MKARDEVFSVDLETKHADFFDVNNNQKGLQCDKHKIGTISGTDNTKQKHDEEREQKVKNGAEHYFALITKRKKERRKTETTH